MSDVDLIGFLLPSLIKLLRSLDAQNCLKLLENKIVGFITLMILTKTMCEKIYRILILFKL